MPHHNFHYFDADTGILNGKVVSTDSEVWPAEFAAANAPAGHIPIKGHFDPLSQRVDTDLVAKDRQVQLDAHTATVTALREAFVPALPGEGPSPEFRAPVLPPFFATAAHVIDYQPPQPSSDHEWCSDTKRWRLSEAAQAKAAAAVVANARHAELVAGQHDYMRRAVLGDTAALERLKAIEAEVSALHG